MGETGNYMKTEKEIFEAFGSMMGYNKTTGIYKNNEIIMYSSEGIHNTVTRSTIGYDSVELMGEFNEDGSARKIWVLSHVAYWEDDFARRCEAIKQEPKSSL